VTVERLDRNPGNGPERSGGTAPGSGTAVRADQAAATVAARLRLLAGGKLGRHPRLAATLPGIHDRETASKLAGRCLDLFQQHNQHGERFGTILDRLGPAALEAIGSCRPAGKKAEKKFLS
jgi:dissimilatory sulfite reductase (desulfoviridin) alpha/beta subunit